MSILNMSITGGVFILAVLFLRAIFQNIVPRKTFLVLWLAACALLLIPFRFPLPVSIYSIMREPAADVRIAAQAAGTAIQSAPARTIAWWQLVWIAGGAVLLLTVLIAHGRNLLRFRKAVPLEPHPEEVPAGIRVRRLSGLPSPLVYGILHPTILLPDEDFADPEQLRHIYLHELCHVRHLDVLRRYLMLVTLAVHWFNPLVWIMYFVASQDMEMRCDEQVIRQLGAKKPYATTLVAMETGKMQHLLDAGFSFSSTGSRLKAILKAKRLPVVSILLALALCVSALAVFATDAAEKTPVMTETAVQQAEAQPEPVPVNEPEKPADNPAPAEPVVPSPAPPTAPEPEADEAEEDNTPAPAPSKAGQNSSAASSSGSSAAESAPEPDFELVMPGSSAQASAQPDESSDPMGYARSYVDHTEPTVEQPAEDPGSAENDPDEQAEWQHHQFQENNSELIRPGKAGSSTGHQSNPSGSQYTDDMPYFPLFPED